MPKTNGATDVNQRTRRTATQSELAKKQAVRDAKAERKRVADQKKATKAKQALLAAMGAAPAPTANGGSNVAAAEPGEHDDAAGASAGAGGEGGEDSEDDGEKDGNSGQDARREARPADVEAELDEDEQLDESVANGSVMGAYLKAVFDRLHSETIGDASRSALEAKWLLAMLKQEGADWWLPASSARLVCAKLGLEYGEPAYCRLPSTLMRWQLHGVSTWTVEQSFLSCPYTCALIIQNGCATNAYEMQWPRHQRARQSSRL